MTAPDMDRIRAVLATARARMAEIIADARAYRVDRERKIASITDTAMREGVERSIRDRR